MFYLIKNLLPVDDFLGCWAEHMGRFSRVAGYTSFGNVFLRDPENGQYAVLCPISGERFPSDIFDADTFRNVFLNEPDIVERFARPDDVEKLERRLGPLAYEEVYIPLLPWLGGSGDLSEYSRGGLWTFLEMVGLFRGLGGGVDIETHDGTATLVIKCRESDFEKLPGGGKPRRTRKRRPKKKAAPKLRKKAVPKRKK